MKSDINDYCNLYQLSKVENVHKYRVDIHRFKTLHLNKITRNTCTIINFRMCVWADLWQAIIIERASLIRLCFTLQSFSKTSPLKHRRLPKSTECNNWKRWNRGSLRGPKFSLQMKFRMSNDFTSGTSSSLNSSLQKNWGGEKVHSINIQHPIAGHLPEARKPTKPIKGSKQV